MMTNQVGCYNSSITRVRPFFQALLSRDASGKTWLPALLNLASCNRDYAASIASDAGTLFEIIVQKRNFTDRILSHYGISKINLENCFERSTAPSASFLRWLVENPENMVWPLEGQKLRRFGCKTQCLRKRLFEKDEYVKIAALSELERCGAENSKLKWWAFEGFTEVDCCLETDKLVLFIEGKRMEKLSSATNWYPRRNQVIRNLEVAKNIAGKRKYAVLVIAENELEPITDKMFFDSLPHLSEQEIVEIKGHFLGAVSWKQACLSTGVDFYELPNTTADAVPKL